MNDRIKPTYRSTFTGKQIDELLASIKFKVGTTSIANEFSPTGDPLNETKIASAELCNILNAKLSRTENPDYIYGLISNLQGINLFTDDEKKKLSGMSDQFKGTFSSDAERRDAELFTDSYTGGELTLLLDNGSGIQSFEYWEVNTGMWKPAQLIDNSPVENIETTAPTLQTIHTLNLDDYDTLEMVLRAVSGNRVQTTKLIVTHHNDITSYTRYGDLATATPLFEIGFSKTDNNLNILANILESGVITKTLVLYEM